MVKSSGELPEGDAAALEHTTQPLSSPEWKFHSIARSKTKRVGMPHPEKARQALKRAGLESGSEVSRAKKKMVFEMVDSLIEELHGERKGTSENKLAPFGDMLSSLAQMAKEGSGPTSGMEGLDGEEMVGLSPAPGGRNLGGSRMEKEMVNRLTIASTMPHVKDGVACELVGARDSQKEEKTKATFLGKENVGAFVENVIFNSKSPPCTMHPHLGKDGGKDVHGSDAPPLESSPENLVRPAVDWKKAKQLFSHGGMRNVDGASTLYNSQKAKPITLDAGKAKPMGTAGCHEGTPSLSFTDLETKYLSEKLGLALVGKFSHSLPSTFQIQKSFGGMGLVGAFTWKHLNAKHILIQFQEVADYTKVLNGPNGNPNWLIDIHPMRVFKWAPDFDTFFESPIVAVWCNIMGIPAHLFEESALMAIGKLLGKPLQADHATINQSRLSFARICVEIDISTPPTEEIILNILGKESRHKVAWDRIPLFCANCKHVGHTVDKCHALGRKERDGGKNHQKPTTTHYSSNVSKIIRREWRPKVDTWAGTSTSYEHRNKDKECANKEKRKEGTTDVISSAPRAANRNQPSVDEDGFQVVSRKRKGKVHEGDLITKGHHIDDWRLKENVATVTFGSGNSDANEPGTGSMNVSCGLPSREIEGFIEDLDPGETVPCGGIPIAGLN